VSQSIPLAWPLGWPRTSLAKRLGDKRITDPPGAMSRARLELLEQLARAGAEDVTISTNRRLRRDGWPSGEGRRPEDDAIVACFTLGGRRLAMACDRFIGGDENVLAISQVLASVDVGRLVDGATAGGRRRRARVWGSAPVVLLGTSTSLPSRVIAVSVNRRSVRSALRAAVEGLRLDLTLARL